MISLEEHTAFAGLGIPDSQITELSDHISTANQHVFLEVGPTDALAWLEASISNCLDQDSVELIKGIVADNYTPDEVVYAETGYDSCQSHRALSKVVSEAILLGGLAHECQLLGLEPTAEFVKNICGSTMELDDKKLASLASFTALHGGNQDFLFPGVTASDEETPSLGHMAYRTLSGRPLTSVRTLTGVGGLRADADWNHVTDLVSFADLKVSEDKRYYPGLGVFYLVKNCDLEALPACQLMKAERPELFELLSSFKKLVSETPPKDYEGVSVLCSALIPVWAEMKQLQAFTTSFDLNLESDFHSPSYEFMILRTIFEKGISLTDANSGLAALGFALKKSWSFNSTIHLPWTSRLAPLSNALVGRVTNLAGDNAFRYGVGQNGKSLEVVKYCFGSERRQPYGVAGLTAFALKSYSASGAFEGPSETMPLLPNNPLWHKIGRVGFLNTALEEIS